MLKHLHPLNPPPSFAGRTLLHTPPVFSRRARGLLPQPGTGRDRRGGGPAGRGKGQLLDGDVRLARPVPEQRKIKIDLRFPMSRAIRTGADRTEVAFLGSRHSIFSDLGSRQTDRELWVTAGRWRYHVGGRAGPGQRRDHGAGCRPGERHRLPIIVSSLRSTALKRRLALPVPVSSMPASAFTYVRRAEQVGQITETSQYDGVQAENLQVCALAVACRCWL